MLPFRTILLQFLTLPSARLIFGCLSFAFCLYNSLTSLFSPALSLCAYISHNSDTILRPRCPPSLWALAFSTILIPFLDLAFRPPSPWLLQFRTILIPFPDLAFRPFSPWVLPFHDMLIAFPDLTFRLPFHSGLTVRTILISFIDLAFCAPSPRVLRFLYRVALWNSHIAKSQSYSRLPADAKTKTVILE